MILCQLEQDILSKFDFHEKWPIAILRPNLLSGSIANTIPRSPLNKMGSSGCTAYGDQFWPVANAQIEIHNAFPLF